MTLEFTLNHDAPAIARTDCIVVGAFADNSLIFIDKQKNIPTGICRIGDRSSSAIELSCDENGKIYNGKWTKRCASVNPEGTDCL